jgi:nucleotide-binding universal stress UspA family protein
MKILLAIDDSKYAGAAINQILAQTGALGAEVRVLHVVEPMPVFADGESWGSGPEFEILRKEQEKHGEELVTRAAKTLRDAGCKVTTKVEWGYPKVVILDQAREWRADLIVLGSHGRKSLEHFLIGSVSEAIARHAGCSVEIVRQPKH